MSLHPEASHSISNHVIFVIDNFFAVVFYPNDVISATFTSLAFEVRLYLMLTMHRALGLACIFECG